MRPAGMSSDEDDDDYYSMNLIPRKRVTEKPKIADCLPPDCSNEIRNLLDNSSKCAKFHQAARDADFRRMEELIEMGVSVDDSRLNEWTPLMDACSKGDHEVVNFLLVKGADPNLHKELFTPLMACCNSRYALDEGRLECARLLLQYGARVNATDKYKTTALMMAVSNGLDDIVDELLNSPEIDINATDREGWTALFHAVNNNYKSIVKKLITAGVDVNVVNERGEYGAIELARMKNKDIEMMLRESNGEVITDEAIVSQPGHMFNYVEKCLEDFRKEFPDEKGNGGFSGAVRDIFIGAGLENLYVKLKIKVGFPEFLAGTDLAGLGIKFEPVRRKIQKQIHRYHLAPWQKSSLCPVRDEEQLDMYDYIVAISNVVEQLAIMNASVEYVRRRIDNWEGRTYDSFNRCMMDSLIGSYVESGKTCIIVMNMMAVVNKIKSVKEVEDDHIDKYLYGPRSRSKNSWKSFWFKSAIACTVLYLCCKSRLFFKWL